jgi:hypothetical protein
MEVTKELDFRYIWIDSLCILQDDEQDWRRESSTMGDVYHSSALNIAATKSSSGEGGCFSERKKSHITPCRVDLIDDGTTTLLPGTYLLSNPNLWNDLTKNSPLFSRAWAIQELALTPRILHFARDQMLWECSQLQASETYPRGNPGPISRKITLSLDSLSRAPEKYFAWRLMVERYSLAKLTYPQKDKLLAVSGMAQKLGIDDKLYAGLWYGRLPYELLWKYIGWDEEHQCLLPEQYQAPSWSWASLNEGVEWIHGPEPWDGIHQDNIYVRIESIHLEHCDLDSRAPLKRGELRLWGPLLKPTDFTKVEKRRSWRRLWRRKASIEILSCHWSFNADPRPKAEIILWLMILREELDTLAFEDFQTVTLRGLCIAPTGKKRGEYTRLGLCTLTLKLHPTDIKGNLVAILREAFLQDENGYEAIDNSFEDGIPRHLVSII